MIDLCKIFGVEEGEEFKFGNEIYNDLVYKVSNNILWSKCEDGKDFTRSTLYINELLIVKEIIKLPKKKEFTDDELAIMRSLPKEFEWIARDTGTNSVIAFKEKPIKNEYGNWGNKGRYCILVIFNHLFPTIQCKDEEPVFIDDYVERDVE